MYKNTLQLASFKLLMALNPHGRESTFLNFKCGRRGGFYFHYNLQCIKVVKGRKNVRKIKVLCIQFRMDPYCKNPFCKAQFRKDSFRKAQFRNDPIRKE